MSGGSAASTESPRPPPPCETCATVAWLPARLWCNSCTDLVRDRPCTGRLERIGPEERARLAAVRRAEDLNEGRARGARASSRLSTASVYTELESEDDEDDELDDDDELDELMGVSTSRAAARDTAASLLNVKARLRDFTGDFDVDLQAIAAKNLRAVERKGGLKVLRAQIQSAVEAESEAKHAETVSALKTRVEQAEARNLDLENQLRRRPSLSADATLRAENKDLKDRLREAEKQIAALRRVNAQPAGAPIIPSLTRARVAHGKGKKGSHYEYPDWFLVCAMGMLVDGLTSQQCRKALRRFQKTFLPHLDHSTFEIPELKWWVKLRQKQTAAQQALAAMQVAAAPNIIQAGFDESELDHINTLNVWVRIAKNDDPAQTQSILLAGCHVQPGGTADAVCGGIQGVFAQAREKVDAVRAAVEARGGCADDAVPVVDGGVREHKVEALMHDTCNAADATVRSHDRDLSEAACVEKARRRAAQSGEGRGAAQARPLRWPQIRPARLLYMKFGFFVSDEIENFSSHAPRTVYADLTLKL